MGLAVVKIKIMPLSPEVDLEKIREEAEKIIETNGAKKPQFEKQPIAFGLTALIVLFAWPENKEIEKLEEQLRKMENVNSVNVIDIRRAIG